MQIIINITDEEAKYLANDLVDIQAWVQDAVAGKVNNCKKRMLAEWVPRLMKDETVQSIPANESALAMMIIERADYKTRVQREDEAKAAEVARQAAMSQGV